MAVPPPLPALPAPFDNIKALLQAEAKTPNFNVAGLRVYQPQIIKTDVINFQPGAILEFGDLTLPWIIVYADLWNFYGPATMRRTSSINLDGANGANGANGAPTPAGDGKNGNNGLPGLPGRDGMPGILMPQVFIFAQQMFWNGRQAVPSDVSSQVLFLFDGYSGGDGGNGGNGGNGTNGNKGGPSQDGWLDCASGPGWGGRGGNAGAGGPGGYGANGGDANSMYMFVDPQQVMVFQAVTVSLKGGHGGVDGHHGLPGKPGKGGAEGDTTTNCRPAGRTGANGAIPQPCPYPEVMKYPGLPAPPPTIQAYTGFAELQAPPGC